LYSHREQSQLDAEHYTLFHKRRICRRHNQLLLSSHHRIQFVVWISFIEVQSSFAIDKGEVYCSSNHFDSRMGNNIVHVPRFNMATNQPKTAPYSELSPKPLQQPHKQKQQNNYNRKQSKEVVVNVRAARTTTSRPKPLRYYYQHCAEVNYI